MKKIYLLGAGSHAKSVSDVLKSTYKDVKIVLVDNRSGAGDMQQNELSSKSEGTIFVTIGDNVVRRRVFEKFTAYKFANVVSFLSYVSLDAKLGKGIFVGNFCHVGPGAFIGDNTIINTAAVVEHDVKVGKHCHLAPNSVLAGNSSIGDMVFVGTSASVINNVTVCSDVVIGAGAVVVENITEPGTYVGCPAKMIKK